MADRDEAARRGANAPQPTDGEIPGAHPSDPAEGAREPGTDAEDRQHEPPQEPAEGRRDLS